MFWRVKGGSYWIFRGGWFFFFICDYKIGRAGFFRVYGFGKGFFLRIIRLLKDLFFVCFIIRFFVLFVMF